MKRYTDSDKWRDRWFWSLSPTAKLIALYLYDRVDLCGVWEVNTQAAEFDIGFDAQSQKIDWREIFEELTKVIDDPTALIQADPRPRIVRLSGGRKWWLTKFVMFQFGGKQGKLVLSTKVPLHCAVIKAIHQNGLDQVFLEYYPNCITSETVAKFKLPSKDDVLSLARQYTNLPAMEAEVFWNYYQGAGWKRGSRRIENQEQLISALQDWRPRPVSASASGIKQQIKSIDIRIEELSFKTHLRPGSDCHELTPEAFEEVQRLIAQKKKLEKLLP